MHKKWSFPLRILSVNMTKFPALFPVDLVTFTEQTLNTNFNFCECNPSYQLFWKYILSSKQDMKFGWFHKFLFYDLYFEFNSLNALNIYYLTIHLYIHCNNICIHKFCFFLLTIVVWEILIHLWLQLNKFFNCNTTGFIFHFSND